MCTMYVLDTKKTRRIYEKKWKDNIQKLTKLPLKFPTSSKLLSQFLLQSSSSSLNSNICGPFERILGHVLMKNEMMIASDGTNRRNRDEQCLMNENLFLKNSNFKNPT